MQQITTYILKKLSVSFLIITLTLLGIVWLSQSLRLVDLIVNRGLPVSLFLYMTILTLPWIISILLPITYFIAVIQTYHRMIMDSEITVMQAAGVSPLTLAKPALLLGGILCLIGYSLTFYIMPQSYTAFEKLRHIVKYDYSSILLQEGNFTELTDHVTVYVEERGPDGTLYGILIHDSEIPDNPVTLLAEEGALIRSEQGPRIVMINGNRQQISPETGQASLLYFDRYSFDIAPLAARKETRRSRKLPELFLHELLEPQNYDYLNPHQYDVYRAQAHQRILLPLYLLVFPALTLSILLGSPYAQREKNHRIMGAILAFIIIESLAISLENMTAQHPHILFLMYLNVGLPLLISVMILRFPRLFSLRRSSFPASQPQ